ncbi:MAG: hypothetical protein LGR52_01460, partial [Candidatus Thiosymbion ectosymbiont of Robbea hypermnestra]|nr:hypothetical protein [Candidatus Thiosymbion ectosymbiont of Robbea hypermnestra]
LDPDYFKLAEKRIHKATGSLFSRAEINTVTKTDSSLISGHLSETTSIIVSKKPWGVLRTY